MILHTPEQYENAAPRTIQEGDLVIVYESFNSMKAVYVKSGNSLDGRFGAFPHKEWIGKRFGCKVHSRGNKGWVYLLEPSPELWTIVLKHRTQILYVADISLVCSFLELSPGSVVLESGTGSGSLTHSLARAVTPGGHVFTFEFHQQRSEEAEREFKLHGLGDAITVTQRNIEELGFPEELHGLADALFLDLPGPWRVVPSAERCLRAAGVFCSFSPCIEQVQRTCETLRQHSFTDVRTVECLLRSHEVHCERMQTELGPAATAEALPPAKRQRTSGEEPVATVAAEPADGPEQMDTSEQPEHSTPHDVPEAVADDTNEAAPGPAAAAGDTGTDQPGPRGPAKGGEQGGWQSFVVTRPAMDARGHTGYLTFARRLPDPIVEPGVDPVAIAGENPVEDLGPDEHPAAVVGVAVDGASIDERTGMDAEDDAVERTIEAASTSRAGEAADGL